MMRAYKTAKFLSGVIGVGALGVWLTACSSAESGEEVAWNEDPAICNANDFQNVETYTPADGVPRSFIDEHQGPVGFYGCSGTLVGDGLFITAAHCIAPGSVPSPITFNHQLDSSLNPRPETDFETAEVVEDDGRSGNGI